MPVDAAGYRTHLDNLLASAVDSTTWTTAIKDQALRMGLQWYDHYPIYETSFTVTVAGHSQDMSGITAIKQVLATAYPWDGHTDLADLASPYRFTGPNIVWMPDEPQIGELIRVRYLKAHVIKDLDSAAATTVPDLDQTILSTYAAGWACYLRARQLSENPAPPRTTIANLDATGRNFIDGAHLLMRPVQPAPIAWSQLGLI